MLDPIRRDVRYALRSLRRTPGFTAAAILSLTLGLGASMAILGRDFSASKALSANAAPLPR